jgi:hypothetical protein
VTTNTHEVLREVVALATCKPGWQFGLKQQHSQQMPELVISVTGPDSSDPERLLTVRHPRPVPEANYNRASWVRWLFEQCRLVEDHELGEWFRVGREQPFLPLHGPGEDPYMVHEFRPEVDALTTQDGSVREPYP